jgi:hypothetical protein
MSRSEDCFRIAISIRAYSENPNRDPVSIRLPSDTDSSPWTLAFDCETTIDATQRLRFGFYQIRKGENLDQEGIFYDPNAITIDEEALLGNYATMRQLKMVTVKTFRSDIFLKYGYTRRATVVGFNLPFDISRIAVDHSPARRSMRGGFSFQMTRDGDDPRVRVKHLSPRAALIDFAKPGEQETPRGMRKRGFKVATYRGQFVDLKTTSAALLSGRFSLESLARHLKAPTQKRRYPFLSSVGL